MRACHTAAAASLPTKISKTTPCKESNPLKRKGRRHGCFCRKKHFDTSGKSAAQLHHRANCRPAHGPAHRALRVITDQKLRSEFGAARTASPIREAAERPR